MDGFWFLTVAFAILIPIYLLFFILRYRFGSGGLAFSQLPQETESRSSTTPEFRDRREQPGHCSSCGEPVDDTSYDRCWNCAERTSR